MRNIFQSKEVLLWLSSYLCENLPCELLTSENYCMRNIVRSMVLQNTFTQRAKIGEFSLASRPGRGEGKAAWGILFARNVSKSLRKV